MNWLSISPTSGHGNTQITLSASTLTGLQDRIATLIATGSQEGQTLSATTVITQKYLTLTEIYFENLTWVTDIPYTGGTATSANCSFSIIAKYSDNSTEDITNLANVTGSLFVPLSGEGERHSAGTLTLTATYEDKTCYGNAVAYQEAFDFSQEPLTFNITSDGTIMWIAYDSSNTKTIKYKLNNSNWKSITSNTGSSAPSIDVNYGDKIQFRGDNTAYSNVYSDKNTFNGSTAGFSVEGNIMSLIDSANFSTLTTLQDDFTFNNLFEGCTGLTSAENLILPATTLSYSCYSNMFQGCTSLTAAPALPATTLSYGCYREIFRGCTSLTAAPELPATALTESCYQYMFWNCKSLTTAPALPAETLAKNCYSQMFQGCTLLTTAPALPATTLAESCYYYMFGNCTSLTTAPALPATTLVESCYSSMFDGCTSLKTAPALPATSLKFRCYQNMFQGCKSLTTAPVLPATTLATNCYNGMFQNCTSLTAAPKLPATTLASWCYQNMFDGCKSLTAAPELPAITLEYYCYDNMFQGCKSLTTVPSILPATTLAPYCYRNMFKGCTSLTTAPALPATTLVKYCYSYMFYDCTSLNYIKCLATDISVNNNCTSYWVLGVSSTGTFVKNPNLNSWERGSSSIPEGWTVVNNS